MFRMKSRFSLSGDIVLSSALIACLVFFVFLPSAFAQDMSSTDYRIIAPSENPIGGTGSSADYQFQPQSPDTIFDYNGAVATLTGTPTTPHGSATATITVGGPNVTQYRYSLNGSAYSTAAVIATPISLSGMTDQVYTLNVIGGDAGGNFQPTTAPTTATWTVSGVASSTTSSGDSYIPEPTIDVVLTMDGEGNVCPVFASVMDIYGTYSSSSTVYLNDSSEGVDHDSSTGVWSINQSLAYGENEFSAYARRSGENSDTVSFEIERRMIGDTDGDSGINDFDLAFLATNWGGSACRSDFNADGIVNDFDLAGLAAHWGQ